MGAWVIGLGSINLCNIYKSLLESIVRPFLVEDGKNEKVLSGNKKATDFLVTAYNLSEGLSVDNFVDLFHHLMIKIRKKRFFSVKGLSCRKIRD